MTAFDENTQAHLREKLDYELWLLDFLSSTQEYIEGGSHPSKVTLTNRQPGGQVAITVTDDVGAGKANELINAMRPLMLTASFKIFDMIFEWILEENREAGKISRVPWSFSEKIRTLSDTGLVLPPLLRSAAYPKEHLFALYRNLMKFRHEIVHNHRFSLSGNTLRIDTVEKGKFYTIELNRQELAALVRVTVSAAFMLTGKLSHGPQQDALLKYYLDKIARVHLLAEFRQTRPILVEVILRVPEERGVFPADLRFVRQRIAEIHPNVDVHFSLNILGLSEGRSSVAWFFPTDSVPNEDVLMLRQDSYDQNRIPTSDEN